MAVKCATARDNRIVLKARRHLVGQRCDTENAIRGLLGSLGLGFPNGAPDQAAERPPQACVAVARKPAVILHRMTITGEALSWPEEKAAKAA